jgi:phosphate transport system permease protein
MRSARFSDSTFRTVLYLGGIAVSVLLIAIFFSLLLSARPALAANGFRFLTGTEWNPVTSTFHALPFVVGTLLTSLIALILATILSVALSILMGEYFKTGLFASVMRTAVELLAGIPSVVYGFIGVFFLVPVMRGLQLLLGAPPFGVGILTSAVLLAFMILPYSASIGREMINLVPSDLKEAALSLGATPSETIWRVTLPYARSGMLGGVLLSLGRALGETMAVTFIIGNSHDFPKSLFDSGSTLASTIANEFTEATGDLYTSALIALGLILFIITFIVLALARLLLMRLERSAGS